MFLGSKKDFFVFAGIFLAMVLIVWAGYFIWDRYLSEGGKAVRLMEEQTRLYEAKERAYVEAMTADTYGGKTPQETLDLFVAALEKGDIDLASKYFLPDESLSRDSQTQRLNEIKERGLLGMMIQDIKTRAVPDLSSRINENDFKFVLYADDGAVGARINMQYNKYSQLWKIERL